MCKKDSIKYASGFSLLEMLVCLLILGILSLSILKPQINAMLGIRAASFHLQKLQKDINEIAYNAFLSKRAVDRAAILNLINNAAGNNRFFTLEVRGSAFLLSVGSERLRLNIRENANGSFSITCNPNQALCRKLYHRKQSK